MPAAAAADAAAAEDAASVAALSLSLSASASSLSCEITPATCEASGELGGRGRDRKEAGFVNAERWEESCEIGLFLLLWRLVSRLRRCDRGADSRQRSLGLCLLLLLLLLPQLR